MKFFKHKQIKIICALVLCLIVFLGFVTFKKHNFSLSGLEQGGAEGLRYLWVQTLYDPILALPGIETNTFSEVLSSLKEAEEVVITHYEKEEQKYLRRSLHPYGFLETLPSLEEKRRAFIERPSYWSALSYNISLIKSLAYLEDYIRSLSDTIYDLEVTENLAVPGGNTSKLYVSGVLADAFIEVGEKRKESKKRLKCLLLGAFGFKCQVTYPDIENSDISQLEENNDGVLAYAEALRSFYFHTTWLRVYSITDEPLESLPLVRLDSAACTTHNSPTYMFFWRDSRVSSLPALFATPVDDIYFHRLSEGKTLLEEAIAKTGIEYTYQPMNPYLCFDYTLDAGRVRTAFAIYHELVSSPIFTTHSLNESSKEIQELANYEQEIIDSKSIINAETIDVYMRKVAGLLYQEQGKTSLSESDQKRLLSLLTLWRSKSAWLETEIATMEDMTTTSRNVFRYMGIPYSSLILTRSYYSTLLLSGNQTLYREELRFTENRTSSNGLQGNLVRYQGDLEKVVPLDKLTEFLFDEIDKSHSVYSLD